MNILVLGGSGFIGCHLVENLIRVGMHPRVLLRPGAANAALRWGRDLVEVVVGDFLDREVLATALKDIDVVFHLVSSTVPKSSNDNPIFDVQANIIGTLELLEESVEAHVRKIIFASSGGTIYGIQKELPIREDAPTYPISSYGIGKLVIEKYLYLFFRQFDLQYTILRVGNTFGPRQRIETSQGVIATFMDRAARGELVEIWGSGSVIRDYVFVQDVVDALMLALLKDANGMTFNVASGSGRSINNIIEEIETVSGQSIERKYLPGRFVDVPANILSVERIHAILGWAAKTSFKEALALTWEWHQGRQEGILREPQIHPRPSR